TTKDNPVQDEKLVEKKKMEKEVWATKKGELTKVAISNLRWENPEAWEGTEAKLIAETTLKNGVAVKVKLLVNGKEIFTGGGNVASGKLSFSWTVCECGIGEGAGVPEQVTVSAQAEADGKIFAAIGDLTARFLVSTDWENFSQDYKWGAFAVHSEFRQRFHAHAVEVEVESKVVKAWGGYLVKMTRAGISDKIDGCGFAGYRFGRVSGVGSLPNEYFDGEKWKKMPRGFVPQDGEYNAKAFVPLESNPVMEFFVGRKYGMEGHEEFVWPDTFADYSYDAPKYTKKRASWIKDTKTRWSGKFKLRSKGCVGQHKGAGGGHPVRLDFSMSLKERFEPHVIGLCPGNLRSNARCFFYGESRIAMAAHEVGHLVGLPDEYVGGAVDPTINGDGAVAGIDATTLMGQSLGNVKKRHFVNFAEMANRIAKKKTKTATDFVAS
ncbi:MAG TPA: hypothetical protein PK208_05575, partial [Fibrobacteria bacterium]|nr:hypothetical protein [Fibrobacteria bacterium]